jgi:Sulfatase-modifying factor enzyme 1
VRETRPGVGPGVNALSYWESGQSHSSAGRGGNRGDNVASRRICGMPRISARASRARPDSGRRMTPRRERRRRGFSAPSLHAATVNTDSYLVTSHPIICTARRVKLCPFKSEKGGTRKMKKSKSRVKAVQPLGQRGRPLTKLLVAGNVWEWTSDWYRPDYYQQLAATRQVARNPQGPPDSADPSEPRKKKRVMEGGSFLCTDEYCTRYMPGARGKGEPDTGTNHLGFRCVRSAK